MYYTVTYRALPSGSVQRKTVTAPANQTTLTGLNKYTNYSIVVFASTCKGAGNISAPIFVVTDEDSKCADLLLAKTRAAICSRGNAKRRSYYCYGAEYANVLVNQM